MESICSAAMELATVGFNSLSITELHNIHSNLTYATNVLGHHATHATQSQLHEM